MLGSPPLAPKLLREFLLSLVGFWVAAPLCRSVGFWVAAPSFVPPLPGGRRPLTHSPRREEVSGPAQVPTPRLLGASKRWCCFGSHALPSRTVALITQSYPAGTGALVTSTLRTLRQLSATWARDFHFEKPYFKLDVQQFFVIEGSWRSRPELEELDAQQFFVIEGSCRSRPELEELDGQQFFAIEGSCHRR